jgi:hypothetical protein
MTKPDSNPQSRIEREGLVRITWWRGETSRLGGQLNGPAMETDNDREARAQPIVRISDQEKLGGRVVGMRKVSNEQYLPDRRGITSARDTPHSSTLD